MRLRPRKLGVGKVIAPVLCVALLSLLLSASAYGEDSCITCHTDEDLLEENLAEATNKTSAMQAGSG